MCRALLALAFGAVAVMAKADQHPALLAERQIEISSVTYVPSPTQSGIVASCTKYLETNPTGASCSAFASRAGIALQQLYAWNTILGPNGENCATQFLNNEYYCIGVSVSSSPSSTTTTTKTPSAAPGPTQSGIVASCTKYLQTNPTGASCSAFASRAGITPQQLYAWNTILGPNGENCMTMFMNSEWYCVGVSSSATASPTTSSSTSSTTSPFTWTSVQTNPKSYNMALTTVFTPPPECTGSFTQVGLIYSQDVVVPAPHKTLTSCYPSQFYSSIVGAANGVSLPSFSQLVCPSGWDSLPYNSTYVACCPENWNAYAPNLSDAQRPLSGVVCRSFVISGMVVDITSFDSAGSTTVSPLTAGSTGVVLYADGFDGFSATAVSTKATTTSSSSSACVKPTLTAVTFNELVTTTYGQNILISGSIAQLGSWNTTNAVLLSASQYTDSNPLWTTTIKLPAGATFQYKYILQDTDGSLTFESDPNRLYIVPSNCAGTASEVDSWK
jgi:LysM repeat protein